MFPISFYAGKKALSIIRDKGLAREDVNVVAGAAGGPKWLVLNHLDRVLFSSWLKGRKNPLYFLGSSIGSWRFAAASRENPIEAIEKFQEAYIHQRYRSKPTPEEVSRESRKVLDHFIDDAAIDEILSHPVFRLNFMAVRCRHVLSSDKRALLLPGLAAAFFFNMMRRSTLKFFFNRSLFYYPEDRPPFLDMSGFPIQKTALTKENLKAALLASGSIPLVMTGVKDIPGASPGIYRDGGVVDYHLDIDFLNGNTGLVLYPHYSDRIIPGWFDKKLRHRMPSAKNMENVLMISPSKEFVERLPHRKIPDRNDFLFFQGRDRARFSYWLSVVNESKRLGDAFWDVVESGRISQLVKPMPFYSP
ncbi:MAG: patatin-like phospholipase family protein [Deltaproteobacteria bacterium]|nr:patatin-like phospholipase family protein [Deltaproteobacteria bacterium]